MVVKRYILIILLCLNAFQLSAGKIEKGFQALDIYNYFDAKRLFEKALKKDNVAAAYGLSIIYHRNDNPFFNLDSAHRYIVQATSGYRFLSEKKKTEYNQIHIDSAQIYAQRSKVSEALFIQAKLYHTVAGYQNFLDRNEWSEHYDSAIYYRDYLAFEIAMDKNESAAFIEYMERFPESELFADAKSSYERLNYREKTATNNFIDYVSFVNNFPDSPYRYDAEDQIYEIATKTTSLESYQNFIKSYPENRNVPQAWKKLYNTYLQENYSSDGIQAFLKEFKDYPYKEDIVKQLEMVDKILYPIKSRNKMGYLDETGELYIKPKFDLAETFNEGLAIVSIEGKYGFVDKSGELVIPAIFDDAYKMNEGHAVVGIKEKWGLINRSGEFVIQPIYEDLGNLNEGFCYFSEGEHYGYFDKKGVVRLKETYNAANDFHIGKAIVSNQAGYGLIDVFGTTSIPYKYERLLQYDKDRYAARFDGYWGLLNSAGDTILPFEYDFIGKINNARAIVEKDDMFNYINPSGQLILKSWIETYPEYRQLAVFTNNYARIELDNGYNLIDTNGRKLFTKDKEDIGNFGEYIAVKKGDKWGYVNKNGSLIIGYNYTAAASFEGRLAKAGGAPLVGVINKTGTYQVEPYFERIEFYNDTLLLCKSRGEYGVLTTEGDTLLNFRYVSIEPFSKDVLQLVTREEIYYYQVKSNKFIRKEEE